MRASRPLAVTILALGLAATLAGCGTGNVGRAAIARPAAMDPLDALELRANKDWQIVQATVNKILPDDTQGNPHQHFLIEVAGKAAPALLTAPLFDIKAKKKLVKVAHNTALAPHVPVVVGEPVELKCEYIRTSPMDVAHWTHYDPKGGEGGYIKYEGKIYDRL